MLILEIHYYPLFGGGNRWRCVLRNFIGVYLFRKDFKLRVISNRTGFVCFTRKQRTWTRALRRGIAQFSKSCRLLVTYYVWENLCYSFESVHLPNLCVLNVEESTTNKTAHLLERRNCVIYEVVFNSPMSISTSFRVKTILCQAKFSVINKT